ncbi:MAG: hypothetical protein LLF98_02425 [Clostridium sp.]|uniref:hypothetical protein n=1 Tax=Clostridium sp. TaxID=1506 RepID=UPI0025C7089D|nr:hypothetical protein [Clostridium sp.]MCE5220138.1 hypothetical protein [Clostridium sp.]
MDEFNNWFNTGNTENGLEIWCAVDVLEGEKYLKVKYKKDGKQVDTIQVYPVKKIKMLSNLIDIINYKTNYPHIDLVARR